MHGPYQLRGIEIYKERPIFYSLGNFMYDDLRTPVGADMLEAHGKDPRIDTDPDVTPDEEAKGYPSAEGFLEALSEPVYYQSVVTVSRFEQNELAELRLYSVELGFSKGSPTGVSRSWSPGYQPGPFWNACRSSQSRLVRKSSLRTT